MAIANVTLNNTFDEWRTVTNQVITFVNEIEGGNLTKFYSNSAVLTVTENVARGGKNYITLNTSSNVLDTSTLNVATANAVNVVFAALANTDARLILVSNDANTINAVANAAIIHSNLAFEQANTARVHANAAFLAANNFASDVGSAANAYARTVGTAGNSYTQTVGTAGNTYTETVGTAGNNYTRTVGTVGNTYTQTVGAAGNNYTNAVGAAGNSYTQTVGTAGNNYMITTGVSIGSGANAYAISIGVGIGSGANAYAITVGTAGNTYVETVGTAGNNYTRTVGTAGNTYAETVGTAGNNYTRTVGTAGNNYTITVGNAGNTFTSQSFDQANTARIHSNNAYSQANLAFELASLASGNNANTLVSNKAAFDHANSAFEQANTARVHANAAFAAANNAVTDFSPAFIQANTARNHANAAFATANIAFANANTVMISAQAAFTVANASFLHANAGFAATNSAFDQANTARVHANTAHASANAGLATANASYAFGNSAHSIANLAFTHANNAYLAANTANNMAVGNTIANGMYQTRSTRSQLNFIETNQIIYNIVDDSAGNRINVSANIVGITPVAITSNAAFLHANAAFATTNANYAFSNSAHSIANLAFTHANNAYATANALSSGFSNTSGSSFAGNMQIPTGNLTIGDGITQGIRLHVNSWIGIANVFPQVEVMGGSQFIQFNANTNFGGWNDLMLARDISIIYSRGAADDSANLIIGPWTDSSFGYKQDGAGRHGFNTSNPRHVLDANGTANISSTLTVGANIIVRGTSITINGLEVVQNTANQTITNKRVTSRVASTASNSATPTLNTDNTDHFIITGQTVNITSMTTNLSGTPTDGQKLIISMTAASGTPTVAWGATFESSGSVTLPTSISTTRIDIGFLWNAATSKWRCVAAI